MINKKELVERKEYLEKIIASSEKALKNAPEGSLRGVKHGKSWQYFYRKPGDRGNGIYLNKTKYKTIQKLGQKKYYSLLLQNASSELVCVNEMLERYENGVYEEVFAKMPAYFQNIVVPIVETDEAFLEKWMSMEYPHKEFYEDSKIFQSNRNEKMRSKSEVLIANMLNKNSIPYHYEKPLFLDGVGNIYPDFTLIDMRMRKEIYWEHFGMMDDLAYSENAVQKIKNYEKNGIYPGDRLILTFETRKNPLDIRIAEKMILDRLE